MANSDETIRVFIENEAGSATKNTFDEETLRFLHDSPVSCPYPFPYGFALNTISGDADSVDCFVVTADNLKSGDTVECTPVHLLEQIEDGEIDHKILCVRAGCDPTLDAHAVSEIRNFLQTVFRHVPGKRMELGALHGADVAMDFVRQCQRTPT